MSRTRIAVLGCGRIGRVHADSVAVSDRAELTWVFDPIEAAAGEVGERYGAAWTTDVEEVLAAGDVDAVVLPATGEVPQHPGVHRAGEQLAGLPHLVGVLARIVGVSQV